MELSDVISLGAAAIAIISAIVVYRQTERINRINLQSAFFDEIYKEHLIRKIPEARRYIGFVNGRLIGTDKLVDELNDIRKDSLYFYYNNKIFFQKLKDIMQELENFLIVREGRIVEVDEQVEIVEKIQNDIERIYACINEFYLGK